MVLASEQAVLELAVHLQQRVGVEECRGEPGAHQRPLDHGGVPLQVLRNDVLTAAVLLRRRIEDNGGGGG
eukprot:8370600-Pyramimonas_sp.AAC.1